MNRDHHLKPQRPDDRQVHVPARQSADDAQKQDTRQQAAEIVRSQIDQIYTHNPPNQPKEQQPPQQENPYQRTHQENFDWRKYHSAWQQYYQQYYQRYYWQQLHAERQKLTEPHAKATTDEITKPVGMITGQDPAGSPKTHIAAIKNDLLGKVKERATKVRESQHFVPLLSALAVGGVFLFLQFNNALIAQVHAYVSPGSLESNAIVVDPTANITVGPEPRLIIPKINVDLPINYNETALDDATIQVALKDGAVHYKLPGANAVPGQFGNTVILGHSSNDIFNQGAYKFVFVLLDRMEVGDTFYSHYEGKRYIYKVTEKKVIDPTEISALQLGTDKPRFTIVTCTPPGTALKRLLVIAEQISPDPSGAQAAPQEPPQQAAPPLPGEGKSVLEQIWDFFF